MNPSKAAYIVPSRIRAIAAIADQHPGTLRLFYGEDSLPTPDFIKEAARRAIDANLTFYTPNAGYPALREAIAGQIQALHGVDLDPMREVVVTASGMVALLLACQATVGPGDSAVVVTPLWPNVAAAVRSAGARAIEVPLGLDSHGFHLDLDRIEAAIEPETKLLALASPGNPTAWTATADDWRNLVELCHRRDLWLLADGVYERIVFDGGTVAPSPLSIPGARERTIVAQSFSKTYRMTGWRVGYLVAPPELASSMTHLARVRRLQRPEHRPGSRPGGDRRRRTISSRESQSRYARHRKIAVDRLRSVDRDYRSRALGGILRLPQT